jgi:hypothetical protein
MVGLSGMISDIRFITLSAQNLDRRGSAQNNFGRALSTAHMLDARLTLAHTDRVPGASGARSFFCSVRANDGAPGISGIDCFIVPDCRGYRDLGGVQPELLHCLRRVQF